MVLVGLGEYVVVSEACHWVASPAFVPRRASGSDDAFGEQIRDSLPCRRRIGGEDVVERYDFHR